MNRPPTTWQKENVASSLLQGALLLVRLRASICNAVAYIALAALETSNLRCCGSAFSSSQMATETFPFTFSASVSPKVTCIIRF